MSAVKKAAGVSDSAVKARTGKTWGQWFAILDKTGAKKMTHQEIVALLHNQHGVGPWWQQMVANTYEQARGLRKKYETTAGDYQVSVTKTISVPVAKVFEAWQDRKLRAGWLGDSNFRIRKATPRKSLRIAWVDNKTKVEANFYAKGESKSQVTVQHSKLANAREVGRRRTYWVKALERLQELLER